MLGGLSGTHFLILLFIILLLFGAPKLPALAKSLGQSMKILKNEVREVSDDDTGESKDSTKAESSSSSNADKTL